MRTTLIRRAKKVATDSLSKSGLKDEVSASDGTSLYEKYSALAKPVHVEGIWRAPRFQPFTKEQFDRAYPPSYNRMKIGLPLPGTFAGDYVDPKFDAPSPFVWTFIITFPVTFWYLYEYKHVYFPSKEEH